MIKANNPSLVSWVDVNKGSDFPIQNLPLGVFKNDQFTRFVSPKFSTLFFPEEIMDSIKVEPLLGNPIINIG